MVVAASKPGLQILTESVVIEPTVCTPKLSFSGETESCLSGCGWLRTITIFAGIALEALLRLMLLLETAVLAVIGLLPLGVRLTKLLAPLAMPIVPAVLKGPVRSMQVPLGVIF